jgi:hypothetical protein
VRDAAGEPADRLHLLSLAQLLLALEQHAAGVPVAERVADRPLEVCGNEMLLDVVGRAFPQRRSVEVAAAVAGDEDERLRGAGFLRRVDEADAGAVGQQLIHEVDVVVVGADPPQPFPDGTHHLEDELEGRGAQRHLDELTRLGIVVDGKHADDAEIRDPRGSSALR